MPIEYIGEYEINYSGVPLALVKGWGAYLTIYAPSSNPMHRYRVFPGRRVSVCSVFGSEAEAEAEARKVALAMLALGKHH
ncbi:hypothetical protein [Janthinobacterium fluminis]|uniref:Uncharacterized protein n=1 Tax=Janthinobacterium fluminis TaxID=2987524 RepID=A0ABT5JTB0_9BURK|nr:hypothetical protein [Janthinobacterium fluminis]MDC8755987.1 hypothetical protein [Janthinobacterium fluminis]